ncbi:MAG: amidohydrolase family protein [Burkholderiales bacterium]
MNHRIDVHHHPSPPSYIAARDQRNRSSAWKQERWSPLKSLEDMDEGGVATAVLSLPHPVSIWPEDRVQARSMAREWNEYMAQMARDYPGRFGVFAALPILDIEGSLIEAEYAFDTLGAAGIGLMTNIGDRWLGDPHYAPLFEELNRRKAVIYTHPVAPACCANMLPDLGDATIEYGTDTTRAIARMMFSGSAARYPDLRMIFSHAGGTMPFLAERLIRAPSLSKDNLAARVPHGVLHELQKFYYDTAQTAQPYSMASARKVIPTSQLLFGTDFPYRTSREHALGLLQCGFNEMELRAIERENAKTLLPSLRIA